MRKKLRSRRKNALFLARGKKTLVLEPVFEDIYVCCQLEYLAHLGVSVVHPVIEYGREQDGQK